MFYIRNRRGSRKSMGIGVRHSFIQLILSSYFILRIVLGNKNIVVKTKKVPTLWKLYSNGGRQKIISYGDKTL